MFIIVTGTPTVGFTACGPYDSEDEAWAVGRESREYLHDNHWWVLPLQPVFWSVKRTAQQWRDFNNPSEGRRCFVAFAGGIGCEWEFVGPVEEVEDEDDANMPANKIHFLREMRDVVYLEFGFCKLGFEALDANDDSLGLFPDQRSAAVAVFRQGGGDA
jgi:hypothetical protein